MNDYLAKPIDQKRLRDAIARGTETAAAEDAAAAPAAAAEPVLDEQMFAQLQRALGRDAVLRMVSLALSDAPATLALIEAAMEAGDIERAGREAHDMGSNFGNFGALRLHRHVSELETACRCGDSARARQLAETLPERVDEAVGALKKRLPPAYPAVA